MLISRLANSMRTLSKFLCHGTAPPFTRQSSAALMKAIDSDLLKALNFLENAQIEPGLNQPGAEPKRATMGLVIGNIHTIARVLQARHHYYLNQEFRSQTGSLLKHRDTLNQSFSEMFLYLANLLEDKSTTSRPSSRNVLMELKELACQLSIDPAINWQTAKSIHACIDLDKILLNHIDELDSLVASLAEAAPFTPSPSGRR